MGLQILILIISTSMLVFVIVAPFNALIFFSMGIVAVAIGIWDVYALIRIKRENLAIKLTSPSEQSQDK